jgi:hypothetical protein
MIGFILKTATTLNETGELRSEFATAKRVNSSRFLVSNNTTNGICFVTSNPADAVKIWHRINIEYFNRINYPTRDEPNDKNKNRY